MFRRNIGIVLAALAMTSVGCGAGTPTTAKGMWAGAYAIDFEVEFGPGNWELNQVLEAQEEHTVDNTFNNGVDWLRDYQRFPDLEVLSSDDDGNPTGVRISGEIYAESTPPDSPNNIFNVGDTLGASLWLLPCSDPRFARHNSKPLVRCIQSCDEAATEPCTDGTQQYYCADDGTDTGACSTVFGEDWGPDRLIEGTNQLHAPAVETK